MIKTFILNYKSKIFTILLLSILSFFLLFVYSIFDEFSKLEKLLVDINSYYVENSIIFENYETLNINEEELKNIAEINKIRISVINKNGYVLFDSYTDINFMENHLDRTEIKKSNFNNFGKSLRYSRTSKNICLNCAKKYNKYYLRISKNFFLFFESFIKQFLFYFITFNLIIFVYFFKELFFNFIFLYDTNNKIKAFLTKSDYNEILDLNYINIKIFNDINYNLNELFKNETFFFSKYHKQYQLLNNIIEKIDNAFLTIDEEGFIVNYNSQLLNIFEIKENIINKHYWEAFYEVNITQLIKSIIKNKDISFKEFSHNKNIYIVKIFKIENEYSLIFIDVTNEKNYEKIKKDFVANVSHELKTPLTSIKGYLETLYDSENINLEEKYYINIILKNTNRLINIVNDLLLLSELENKDFKLIKKEINLNETIKFVSKIFNEKLKAKNLDFEIISNSENVKILGDQFKLEQLIINLLDNAIKYTDKGKVTIEIDNNNQNFVIIKFKDTGIGINLKEIDYNKLFERFYVVDKSRSRSTGGTGLGLSIVKHIVEIHNGFIEIESTVNVGTTFTVYLPK